MTVVDVSALVLEWAQRRSGRLDHDMRRKFVAWDQWLAQDERPSFSEVEEIARYTRVPIGYFFLPEPPIEELPIPDFRVGRQEPSRPSDDLLDTIYLNQRRQAWYEDYIADFGEPEPLAFVGSTRELSVVEAAEVMTEALDYRVSRRAEFRSIDDARSHLIAKFEDLGGLVVLNSMVENNTHRMLNLDEFRGFTLHSRTAPLIFVNGRDTKNGQVFSLLHEFAHVWRGESGVSSGGDPLRDRTTSDERWCDAVAAEIAVPTSDLQENFDDHRGLAVELDRLAERYRCSTLVILLKARSDDLIGRQGFAEIYEDERARILAIIETLPRGNGGNFYHNQPFRIGRTLSRAIIRDTELGTTPMTEALRLLAFKSVPVFDEYANQLGEA